MKVYIIILLIFSFVFWGFQKPEYFSPKMPLVISYIKKQPPDSIQDFMKVYFQAKKVEVISFDSYMSLYKEQLMGRMNDWVTSGKANGMNESNLDKYKEEISRPLCNVLAIKIFNDSISKDSYVVDSIHWYTGFLPVKDTSKREFKSFVPLQENKNNPYLVLKSFADKVLASRLLK